MTALDWSPDVLASDAELESGPAGADGVCRNGDGQARVERTALCADCYLNVLVRVKAELAESRPKAKPKPIAPKAPLRDPRSAWERAVDLARVVHAEGRTVPAAEAAERIGLLSRRTLNRAVTIAKRNGWVVTHHGAGGGYAAGPNKPGHAGHGGPPTAATRSP